MLKKILAGAVCIASLLTFTACSDNTANSSADENFTSVDNVPTKDIQGNIDEVKLEKGDTYAVITVKDYGDITVKLFKDAAPYGVQNFIDCAEKGYYKGTTFHRIVEDFMVQGGIPAGADDDAEYEEFGIETNYKARHFYGAFCYANAMAQNSTQFYIVNNKESQDLSQLSTATMDNYAQTYEQLASQYDKGSDEEKYYTFQAQYYKNMKDFIQNADEATIAKYKEVGGVPSLDGNYTVFGQTVDGFDVLDKISEVEVQANEMMGGQEISDPVEDVIIENIVIKTFEG